ncbi:PsbB mRNA maturation factor Mbb1, chloroplastic [Porphyridium purpureum]|uniref:PsbB mRNA maturation factor Mbb1, chloroplastic n=1 Tax=Porphyridium purpureum TaxID=35688 RepID=A0A5J4YUX7_PORPP|nr:PsbB mRNA maturation factor Mbb1, chloroplastic [Porphyridium purpureum]|eukprot:POR5925..scf227_4
MVCFLPTAPVGARRRCASDARWRAAASDASAPASTSGPPPVSAQPTRRPLAKRQYGTPRETVPSLRRAVDAIRAEPHDGRRWMELARSSHSPAERARILTSAMEWHDDNARNVFLWHALGTAHARAGNAERSDWAFLQGLRRCAPGTRGALYQSLGVKYARLRQTLRAERFFKSGLREDASHGALYVALAELYRTRDLPDLAWSTVCTALRMAPAHVPVWRCAASLLQTSGCLELARDCWGVVVMLAPYDYRAWMHLAEKVRLVGDDETRAKLSQVLERASWGRRKLDSQNAQDDEESLQEPDDSINALLSKFNITNINDREQAQAVARLYAMDVGKRLAGWKNMPFEKRSGKDGLTGRKHKALMERNAGSDERYEAALLLRQAVRINPYSVELRAKLARLEYEARGLVAARAVLERGLSLPSRSSGSVSSHEYLLHMELGTLLMLDNNISLGRESFKRAVELEVMQATRERSLNQRSKQVRHRSSFPVESLHRWALYELMTGDYRIARRILSKAVERAPDHGGVWRSIGELEKKHGNVELARAAFGRAVALNPHDLRIWLSWGKLEREQPNNSKRAIDLLRRAAGLPVPGLSNEQSFGMPAALRMSQNMQRARAEAMGELATLYQLDGEFLESARVLRMGLEVDPGYEILYRMLGDVVAIIHRGDPPAVRRVFYEMLRTAPRRVSPKLLHWFALQERRYRNFERARGLLRRATRQFPKYLAAWMSYALLENDLHSPQRARALFEAAAGVAEEHDINAPYLFQSWSLLEMRLYPLEPERARQILMRGLSLCSMRLDQLGNASSAPRRAVSQDGDDEEGREEDMDNEENDFDSLQISTVPSSAELTARNAVSQLQLALGQLEERFARIEAARELYTCSASTNPKFVPAYQRLGLLEQNQQNYDAARRAFKNASEADPSNGVAFALWAQMELRVTKNLAKARDLFAQASSAEPRNPAVWHAWAVAERQLGDRKRARELFKQALAVAPDAVACLVSVADIEAEHGNIERAGEYYERGISADPTLAAPYCSYARMLERAAAAGKGLDADDDDRWRQVESIYERGEAFVTPTNENAAVLLHSYARFVLSRGDRERALEILDRGMERDPSAIRLYLLAANVLCEDQKYERARDLFKLGAQVNPSKSGPLCVAWAGMERALGDTDSARKLFQQAIRVQPTFEKAWTQFASMEREVGNYSRAEELNMAASALVNVRGSGPENEGDVEDGLELDRWLIAL